MQVLQSALVTVGPLTVDMGTAPLSMQPAWDAVRGTMSLAESDGASHADARTYGQDSLILLQWIYRLDISMTSARSCSSRVSFTSWNRTTILAVTAPSPPYASPG